MGLHFAKEGIKTAELAYELAAVFNMFLSILPDMMITIDCHIDSNARKHRDTSDTPVLNKASDNEEQTGTAKKKRRDLWTDPWAETTGMESLFHGNEHIGHEDYPNIQWWYLHEGHIL